MSSVDDVVLAILAGGYGDRLYPLNNRAKPAMPFMGNYRIIDLLLSSAWKSGIQNVKVLTQYKSNSLLKHIEGWAKYFPGGPGRGISSLPADIHANEDWFTGTSDAIYSKWNPINYTHPKIIDIFAGDHLILFDFNKFNAYHRRKKADLTISAKLVPLEEARGRFGVLILDDSGKIVEFQEKPMDPVSAIGFEGYCWVSMGNYAFRPKALEEAFDADYKKIFVPAKERSGRLDETSHDFGTDIIPWMVRNNYSVFAYDFSKNKIPGLSQSNSGMWLDLGTIKDFYSSQMQFLTNKNLRKIFSNKLWPILSANEMQYAPGFSNTFIETAQTYSSPGTYIDDHVTLSRSILGCNTIVEKGCKIEGSIIFGDSTIGPKSKLKNCIIDKGIKIPRNTIIGYDHDEDNRRGFEVIDDITIVPKNYKF